MTERVVRHRQRQPPTQPERLLAACCRKHQLQLSNDWTFVSHSSGDADKASLGTNGNQFVVRHMSTASRSPLTWLGTGLSEKRIASAPQLGHSPRPARSRLVPSGGQPDRHASRNTDRSHRHLGFGVYREVYTDTADLAIQLARLAFSDDSLVTSRLKALAAYCRDTV